MTARILVVHDDPAQRRQIKAILESQGYVVEVADSARTALEFIRHHRDEIKAIQLDLTTSGMEGHEFMATLHAMDVDLPVIVQTGLDRVEQAVEAMRAGAFDFLVSPVSPERLHGAITSALKLHGRHGLFKPSRRSRSGAVSFADIIAVSAPTVRVVELARRAAHSTIPVVIEGEGGVGKEMVARAIHSGSDRAAKPFVAVNCDATAAEYIEELLFGDSGTEAHAANACSGKFCLADGGTLFLDEIGSLPLSVQARLLQAVQQGDIACAGSQKPRKIDVRLISATRRNLIEEVKAGRFREDLYYRLNVYPITIPALRRRRDDIPYLARSFVERFSLEQRLSKPLGISAEALALLTSCEWHGNVRELENALFRAVILANGPELTTVDFPQISAQQEADDRRPAVARVRLSEARRDVTDRALPGGFRDGLEQVAAYVATSAEQPPSSNVIVSTDDSGNVRKLADVEEELIRFALKFYRGQMSQVARKLGIGRSTLYRKLKDYGIDPENPQKNAA